MARNRGIFNFSANLEVKKNAPLDSRVVVDTLIELTETSTWADSDNKVWLYDGIVVSVLENHGLYMLTNYNAVTAPIAYTDSANWVAVDASAAKTDVTDNLTSTSTTSALSANQGRVLKDNIDNLKSSLSAVYIYKGSVDTYDKLPTEVAIGDTYNVVAAYGNTPAGTNYAWNGESWDPLGGSVDLSAYYTKSEADKAISGAVSKVSGDVSTLKESVAQNTSALNVLNGTEETAGSLANTLKIAKDYTSTQLTGYVAKVEGSSLIPEEKLKLIDTNATNIEALKARVEANEAALATLNGDASTSGSVINTVNSAINSALEWNEF